MAEPVDSLWIKDPASGAMVPVLTNEPVFTLAQVEEAIDMVALANYELGDRRNRSVFESFMDIVAVLRGSNQIWIQPARDAVKIVHKQRQDLSVVANALERMDDPAPIEDGE